MASRKRTSEKTPEKSLKIPKLSLSPATSSRTKPSITISALPPEVLLEVFRFLSPQTNISVVPRVCTLWSDLHTSSHLYRRLHFTASSPSTVDAVYILSLASQLHTLSLEDRADGNTLLKAVAANSLKLKSLTLTRCRGDVDTLNLSGFHLNKILRNCRDLKVMTLLKTWTGSKVFYERMAHLPDLQTIQLGASRHITGNVLASMAMNCHGLKHLQLFHSTDAKGRSKLTDESVSQLSTLRRNTLMTLKISAVDLTNAAMWSISTCHQLTTLYLYQLGRVDDEGILHLARLRQLQSLHISGWNSISAAGWRSLFQSENIRTLLKLSLETCVNLDDEALTVIGQHLLNVKVIWLTRCAKVTAAGVSILTELVQPSCEIFRLE